MNVKSSPDTRLSEIVNHQGKTIKRRSVIIGSQAKVNRVRDRAAYPPFRVHTLRVGQRRDS